LSIFSIEPYLSESTDILSVFVEKTLELALVSITVVYDGPGMKSHGREYLVFVLLG
jgi:hypothetical protein